MKIDVCNREDIKVIVDGLNAYNLEKVAALASVWKPLEFNIKDNNDVVVGGVLAGINYWNGLEIKILWVEENFRKQGFGSQLLMYLENEAKKKGASMAMVDTFDFQAEDFYIKHKYEIIGELKGFPKNHKRIYFSKVL